MEKRNMNGPIFLEINMEQNLNQFLGYKAFILPKEKAPAYLEGNLSILQ